MSNNYKPIEILRPYVRDGAFPIDSTTVFKSYDEAVEYAHNNKSAYATQIIGIDDSENKVTGLYQISYDPNKQFRYVLQEIGFGIGGTSFRFKGTVPTFDDLPMPPDLVLNGDTYLVETPEPEMYVAFVDSKGDVSWKKLSLNVSIAKVTKSNDGLMSKELYSTMYNETGKDAVYFSRNNSFPDPNTNSWLVVEHTNKEEETGSYTLASVGKTKEIVGTLMKQSAPHISIEAIGETATENAVNTSIKPELRIYYYPELGGDLDQVIIQRRINNVLDPTPAYEGHPELLENADGEKYFDWKENMFQTASTDTILEYVVTALYAASDDGNVTSGFCDASIQYIFYQRIYYGTNLEEYTEFLKPETEISLKYDPSQVTDHINVIYIRFPKTAELDQIIYVPQNDYNAIDLFTIEDQTTYYEYEYKLGQYSYFLSPGEFKFILHKKNN